MKLRWNDLRLRIQFYCANILLVTFTISQVASAATYSEAKELQTQINEIKKEITAENKRLAENNRKIQELSSSQNRGGAGSGANCSACNEVSGSACTERVFKSVNLIDGQPWLDQNGDNCRLLYEADPTLATISIPCASTMKHCKWVQDQLELDRLKNENASIKLSLTDRKEQQLQLTRDLADLRKDCPDCDSNGGFRGMSYGVGGVGIVGYGGGGGAGFGYQQRSPKLGDYIVASLPWISQMALGGMSLGLGAMTLNSYSDNYASYLNQCAMVGVPCGQPSLMMGMGGMGLMGMGLMGMGMPMMGMGLMGGGIGGLSLMGMGGMGLMGMGMPMMGGIGLGIGGMGLMGMGMPMMGGYGIGMGGMGLMGMGMPMMGGYGIGMGGMGLMGMGMPMMGGIGLGIGGMGLMGMGMPMMGGYGIGMGGMGLMGMGMAMGMPMMGGYGIGMGGMGLMGMGGMGGYSGGWMNPYSMYSSYPGTMMSMGYGYPMSAIGTGYNSALYPYGAGNMYMNPYMGMGYNNGQYQSMYGSSMMNQAMASQYAQQNQQNLMVAQQAASDAQLRMMSIMGQSSMYGGMSSPWSMPYGSGSYPFGYGY